MSDYTNGYHAKSSYNKTGKKVKCIDSNRRDLTYKKVYDVFVDNGGHEFVIDESCDRLYDSMEFPLWIEVFDDDDDKGFDSTTSKPQFKVGDKVKVVDTEQISTYTNSVRVNDVGVITATKSLKTLDSYLVTLTFDGNAEQESWWFTDECIKLVENVADDANIENKTTKSESVVVRKFKVGDLVRVTSTDYISQYDASIEVGDIGVIFDVDDDDYDEVPYQIRNWWFPESDLELVSDGKADTSAGYNPLTVQQSGSHYKNGQIQPIEYSERNNLSMCQGNIVKYITRHKEKNGVDDLAKVVHYALLEALFVYGEDGATELRDKVDSLINVENKE